CGSAIGVFSLSVYSLMMSFNAFTRGPSLKRQYSEPTGILLITLSIRKTCFESFIYFVIHTSTGYSNLALHISWYTYHSKTSKHYGNEPSGACDTNKVEILT